MHMLFLKSMMIDFIKHISKINKKIIKLIKNKMRENFPTIYC